MYLARCDTSYYMVLSEIFDTHHILYCVFYYFFFFFFGLPKSIVSLVCHLCDYAYLKINIRQQMNTRSIERN